jgi:hypothetical protein
MPYIGHLLTAEGVKPDPEKIAAITNMEKPTDVKGVQRLLGMANYLTKFFFERETTVSCTNFLAVNDRYARRFSFVCVLVEFFHAKNYCK